MSLRPTTVFVFLFVLSIILLLEQFFVGLLQIAFNDPNLNFSLFRGVILFFRLLLNVAMTFVVMAGCAIGSVLGFISLEELADNFVVFTDSLFALSDYLIQIILAIIGTITLDRLKLLMEDEEFQKIGFM